MHGDAVRATASCRHGTTVIRAAGYRLAVMANQPAEAMTFLQTLPVDRFATSAGWGVAKPDPAFFARVAAELGAAPGNIAYVGDRVDNDVLPARRAGMLAVHLRRGPWGVLHADWPEAAQAPQADDPTQSRSRWRVGHNVDRPVPTAERPPATRQASEGRRSTRAVILSPGDRPTGPPRRRPAAQPPLRSATVGAPCAQGHCCRSRSGRGTRRKQRGPRTSPHGNAAVARAALGDVKVAPSKEPHRRCSRESRPWPRARSWPCSPTP